MLVPGLCLCVYLYLLVLNESAAYKVYHTNTTEYSEMLHFSAHNSATDDTCHKVIKRVIFKHCS